MSRRPSPPAGDARAQVTALGVLGAPGASDAPRARRSLAGEVRVEEEKVKGSRFIGVAAPAADVSAAEEMARRLWAEHPDARHVCWAFRGSSRDEVRWVDDGEPSGTAGRPMLAILEGLDLRGAAVAVVRYFGGTKLGTGGLARAYSDAAQAALAAAEVVVLTPKARVAVTVGYAHEGLLARLVAARGGALEGGERGAEVTLRAVLPAEEVEGFCEELRDRTAGRARVERSEPHWG